MAPSSSFLNAAGDGFAHDKAKTPSLSPMIENIHTLFSHHKITPRIFKHAVSRCKKQEPKRHNIKNQHSGFTNQLLHQKHTLRLSRRPICRTDFRTDSAGDQVATTREVREAPWDAETCLISLRWVRNVYKVPSWGESIVPTYL
jgi:hypothetical protein